MQRLALTLSTFGIVVVMLINMALFYQNGQLRRQIAAPQPTQAAAPPSQATELADLAARLDRAERDRAKAIGDANSLRSQVEQLNAAAQERDALKAELQSLRQQNDQLRTEAANLQTMNAIGGQVTPLRGLSPVNSVPRTFMNREQLRAYFTDLLARDWPAEAEAREQATLRALDMAGASGDLRQSQIDSATRSILGFYDHDTKQLVVVTNRASMGVRDRVTYAHEYTHSLQDQHFGLAKLFAQAEGNNDYALALRALVEGDATLTMGLYADAHLSDLDRANYQLEEIQSIDLSGLTFGSGPMVESAAYFPYREGAGFVAALYANGGWPMVDAAFSRPPRSTEQVLHPERYVAGDAPVAVQLPAYQLDGWRTLTEDTLGELYLRIYLERALPFEQAIPACEGWGGDRYQVLGDERGRVALALQTAWDTPEAAQRFYGAMASFVAGLGGSPALLEADGSHLRWQLADRQFYVSLAGNRVLVLHAPDGPALDTLIRQS